MLIIVMAILIILIMITHIVLYACSSGGS
jgi:hypothetical protein